MTKIIAVVPGSIAEEGGIQPGDYLVAVNGREVNDILEFKFITADEEYELTIQKPDGSYEVLDIVNQEGEDLGISFENALMTKARCCANRCIFCFIDQLPKGMRETLYFKDDDSRLSFLQGNYVTLTNLSEREIEPYDQHASVSPMNVSVQATEPGAEGVSAGKSHVPAQRCWSSRRSSPRRGICDELPDRAYVPAINDGGAARAFSLRDLASMCPPGSQAVAVVPVGISRTRRKVFVHEMRSFDQGIGGGSRWFDRRLWSGRNAFCVSRATRVAYTRRTSFI